MKKSTRIPNSTSYWEKIGKSGKNVVIYTHDDMDGIYSAIVMKNYLISRGFNIVGYQVVNYQTGWNGTIFDDTMINVAVDFSTYHDSIDIYIDHHGTFGDDHTIGDNKSAVKTCTGSAYEGICDQLGLPVDEMVLSVIDMIDRAAYDDYGIDMQSLLLFGDDSYKFKSKLEFAGALNQLLKRSDHDTIIEVIHNSRDISPSIYSIFRLIKYFYPANNIDSYKLTVEASKNNMKRPNGKGDWEAYRDKLLSDGCDMTPYQLDFVADNVKKISRMNETVRGMGNKVRISDQDDFKSKFLRENIIVMDGYHVVGNTIVVPDDTYCNAIRMRAVFETDVRNGLFGTDNMADVKWIVLFYGDTIQVASYKKVESYVRSELPVLKDGSVIDNLGEYTRKLLGNFSTHLGYVSEGDGGVTTTAGGHAGIGSVSNIHGSVSMGTNPLYGTTYNDIFRNKIVSDLSGVKWDDMKMKWLDDTKKKKENTIVTEVKERTYKNICNIRCLI